MTMTMTLLTVLTGGGVELGGGWVEVQVVPRGWRRRRRWIDGVECGWKCEQGHKTLTTTRNTLQLTATHCRQGGGGQSSAGCGLKCERCNRLQHTATATHCNTLHCVAVFCSERSQLQHTAPHCIALQSAAASGAKRLQHTATHCIILPCTATHCNTLHYTMRGCRAQ